MRHSFIFVVGFLCISSLMAQSVPPVYTELERQYEAGDYEACLGLEKEVERFASNHRDTIVANSFAYLGDAYYQLGSVDKAIAWFERERSLRTDLGLQGTEGLSTGLYNLLMLNMEAGRYQAAASLIAPLIETDLALYGANSEAFLSSVLSATEIYIQLDKTREAENLLKTTLRQQRPASLTHGVILSELGDLYTFTSRFSKANDALTDALEIIGRTAGVNSPEYLTAAVNLGIFYMETGKIAEAEETFDFVLRQLAPDEPAYLSVLNNQGLVYHSLGQFERAEKIMNEIRHLDSLDLGETHPNFAITLTNLGFVYCDEKKYTKAEHVLQKALQIQKANGGEKTASYARKLNNLARVCRLSGNADRAIALHEEALGIFRKTLSSGSTEYATTLYHLALANWKTGNNAKAIKLLRRSASVRATALGKDHPRYAEAVQRIAEFLWEQNEMDESREHFNEVFENHYFQLSSVFPVLTEEEKAKFYYARIKPSFEKFNAFALAYQNSNPAVRADVFNHQVNTKASIMYATEKVHEAIRTSGDTILIAQFDEWKALKEQIARVYSENKNPGKVDSLQQLAEGLEKEFTRKSAVFADQMTRRKIQWQDIQAKLQPGEAAVEVIRFNDYLPERGGRFTENVIYAFLIVSEKTREQPDMIVLRNGAELEGKMLNFYRNAIRFKIPDERSYQAYIEPLAKFLAQDSIKTIYLSSDGVFNQISTGGILNPETGRYFSDDFNIVQVTNTRELVEARAKAEGETAMLFGFPKFDLRGDAPQNTGELNRALTRGNNLTRGLRGGLLRYMRGDAGISMLPGTKEEISKIAGVLDDEVTYSEENASEGELKSVNNPKVLHVATHGYFLELETAPDEDLSQSYIPNPLLKSGLILAGAENFLRTGVPADSIGNDGILTAYEAMNLRLDETELVVLSACETGLGIVRNGEGVYGLQRAFKLAGARNLIMSLWSVDDDATQKLMTSFYSHRAKGLSTHEAFREAQHQLRKTYPHPFYWSAFILLGHG